MNNTNIYTTFQFLKSDILNLLYGKISHGGDCISPGMIEFYNEVELLDLEKRYMGVKNHMLDNTIMYPEFTITMEEFIKGELYRSMLDVLGREDSNFTEQLKTCFDHMINLAEMNSELTEEQKCEVFQDSTLEGKVIDFPDKGQEEFKAA